MYYSIHVCRAVAAILVVCFHLGLNLAKDKYFGSDAIPLARFFWFGGSAGVAFFFVLSGFIITFIHAADFGRPAQLARYVRKRVVRIYPAYWLVFAGVWCLALAVPALRDSMPTDVGLLVKSLMLLPQDAAVVGGTGAPVIVVAWSLQYELVFYAVVALAIVRRGLLAGVALLLVANFIHQTVGGGAGFPGSFFANHLVVLFAFGMGVAWALQGGWRMPQPLLTAAIATALFFGVGAWATLGTPGPVVADLGYGIFGAFLIVAWVQAERANPSRFVSRTASVLGDSSYVLYLIHFPLIAVLSKAAMVLGLRGPLGAGVAFVGILLACVASAAALHLWIERPLLNALSARPKRPPAAEPA